MIITFVAEIMAFLFVFVFEVFSELVDFLHEEEKLRKVLEELRFELLPIVINAWSLL